MTPSRPGPGPGPGRAVLLVSHQTLNQRGEVRQKTAARLLAWNRPRNG